MKDKKVKKVVTSVRSKVIKNRAGGTMSESAFWAFIRSALRQKSRFWAPILQTKVAAKRPYIGTNKRQKFEYLCNQCKNWFPEKEINVDHMIPAGSLNKSEDLPGFVDRLFCESNHLQCLCTNCHDIKTQIERKNKNN